MSKFASLLLSAFTLGGGVACAPATGAQSPETEALSDSAAIHEAVANIAHHIDAKDWEQLTQLFTNKVSTDYTSLFGGTPLTQSREDLIQGWRSALEEVTTQHHLGPITMERNGDHATAHCTVRGHHFVEKAPSGSTWMVAGSYDFELDVNEDGWKISSMTLNTYYQTGNVKLLQEAARLQKGVKMTKKQLQFESEGDHLVGDLYLPSGIENPPVVVVAGSWTTVKEQMAGTYAARLAEAGYAALAIDARGYGESEGSPQYFESPERKIVDYKNAIAFLKTLDGVDGSRIGALGICAGAGYIAEASAGNDSVRAVGLVASWLHDSEAVRAVYGGEEGVSSKIAASRAAKRRFEKEGVVEYVPTISETDPSAAMYGPFTYYLDEKRGAIPEWSKQFAVMSWEPWLTFSPLGAAKKIEAPTIMVHSDDAVLPDYAKKFYSELKTTKKKLHWTTGGQFDFYDQEAQVSESIEQVVAHFKEHL